MSIYSARSVGLGNVGSYQVSGIPYFKGGILADDSVGVIEFPYITNWIWIYEQTEGLGKIDGPMIAFSEDGFDSNNYFVVTNSNFHMSPIKTLHLKVSKLYYKREGINNVTFGIVAGMTSIPSDILPDNWANTDGVG